MEEAQDKFYKIIRFLRDFTENRIYDKGYCTNIATLFVGEKEEDFIRSTAFQEVRKSVQESGVLVIDTKFTNGQYLKSIGCHSPFYSGIDLFQFGGLSGHVCLIQVQYDCSALHKDNCQAPFMGNNSEAKKVPHKAFEFSHDFQNHGASIPKEVVGWLKDDSIIKVQSNIRNVGPVFGVLDRLEKMLGLCLKSFVELRNLTYLWFNDRGTMCKIWNCPQRGVDFEDQDQFALHMYHCHDQSSEAETIGRSGNAFLAKKLGVVSGEEFFQCNTGLPIWKVDRRKPFQRWSNPLTYSDICDILVPAAFLLKIGSKIVITETAACLTSNIYPYLRELLLIFKNEPCLVGPNKDTPNGREQYLMCRNGVEYQDIGLLGQSDHIPWRPGFGPPKLRGKEEEEMFVKGEVISRNLRQLAFEIVNDAYAVGTDYQDLALRLRPNLKGFKSPLGQEQFSRVNGPMYKVSENTKSSNRKRHGGETGADVTEMKKPKLIPNHKVTSPIFYGRCQKCGSSAHRAPSCNSYSQCLYPLCRISRGTHDTSVCEVLHSVCSACRLRGHKSMHHEAMDLVSLIKIAEAWAPRGVLTSLFLFESDKQSGRTLKNEEYFYNIYNKSKSSRIYEKSLL